MLVYLMSREFCFLDSGGLSVPVVKERKVFRAASSWGDEPHRGPAACVPFRAPGLLLAEHTVVPAHPMGAGCALHQAP